MAVSRGFREFVLGQLAGVRGLREQAMFGGVGLYAGDVFFGLIADDVLYLKVDTGGEAFRPYKNRPDTSMRYFSVPPAALEDAAELEAWVARAIAR